MPVSVASEMLSISTPSFNSRAMSRMIPTSRQSVASVGAGSGLSAAIPAANSVDPVRTAMVDVVDTDSARDPPSRA